MSTVPPHDREERDPNAATDAAAADATPATESGDSATTAGSTDPARPAEPPVHNAPVPDVSPAHTDSTGHRDSESDQLAEPASRTAADRPAGDATVAGTPTPPAEPQTRQLPTEQDDAALREERARRFGRGTTPHEETTADRSDRAADTTATRVDPAPVPVETRREDDPFNDWDDGPQSRAAAHWWGILIAIVFAPVAWYLLTDGGERVAFSLDRNLEAVNVAGLLELAGGLVCTIVLLLAARWSSVGSIIVGSIGTLIGAAFLAVPVLVSDFLASQSRIFDRLGQFGTNLYDHLVAEGHAGRLLLYGIVLIFVGVVSHGARRQGRREERRRIAAETVT